MPTDSITPDSSVPSTGIFERVSPVTNSRKRILSLSENIVYCRYRRGHYPNQDLIVTGHRLVNLP